MRDLTLILPYYINGGMLVEHQQTWRALADDLKSHLHVIVVDDGSPTDPALPHVEPTSLASFRLYRTLEDRRWNWLFCRNLGASEATTEWILLTDIDHVLPGLTLRHLLSDDLDPTVVYRFSRVDAPSLTPYKPHPNTWMLTKEMFDQIGGYDERFSGWYGSDADFRERVHTTARAVILRDDPLIRYPREVIPNASTTTYLRKQVEDGENIRRIRAERDQIPNWTPLRVTFPYVRLV